METNTIVIDNLDAPNNASKLVKKQRDQIAVRLINERGTDLAKEFEVSDATISLIKKNNKTLIEGAKELIVAENVQDIVDIAKQDIENVRQITEDYAVSSNITSEKTAYKSLVHRNTINPIAEKIGIHPSRAINNNFTQINNKTQIAGSVLKMFAVGANRMLDDDSSQEIVKELS